MCPINPVRSEEEVNEMLTIRDVMTTPAITVRSDTPLKEVAWMLIDSGISGMPVVDEHGTLVGVVSEADFLVKEQGATAVRHRRLARLIGESEKTRLELGKLAARTAGEAMTSPPLTIEPTRSIQDAAAAMTRLKVNRLPVVAGGQVIGIVTRADLVRAYLRTDEELVRTIREDVLLRMLWLDPDSFEISVRNGEVSIRGHAERRSTATIVPEAIAMVPGVVSLDADIGWSFDDRDLQPATPDAVFPFRVE
jgi:CBS domain-containing protein